MKHRNGESFWESTSPADGSVVAVELFDYDGLDRALAGDDDEDVIHRDEQEDGDVLVRALLAIQDSPTPRSTSATILDALPPAASRELLTILRYVTYAARPAITAALLLIQMGRSPLTLAQVATKFGCTTQNASKRLSTIQADLRLPRCAINKSANACESYRRYNRRPTVARPSSEA